MTGDEPRRAGPQTRGPAVALQALRADAAAPLAAGPERRRFDALLTRLGRLRDELHAWGEALPRWEARYHAQVLPLLDARDALDVDMIERLDRAHADIGLGKAGRALVSARIRDLAVPLIDAGRADLAPVLARHQDPGDGNPADAAMGATRQAIAAHYGLEPDDLDGIAAHAALFAREQARARDRQAHARRREALRSRRAGAVVDASGPAPLRALYRRLAADLHPDRARDADDGARRTVLMQRLNAAYRAGDLIGLIELQAGIGLLDAAGVDAMEQTRLEQYNAALARQAGEIERELERVVERFCAEHGLRLARRPKPERLDRLLAQLKRGLESELAAIREELRMLERPESLRRWLRAQRKADDGSDDGGDPQ